MKHIDYATGRERRTDQILGFLAFPLLNVPLGIILWFIPQTTILSRMSNPTLLLLISALPWIVNGIVLVLAFLLRPDFAVGYIAFIGAAVAVVTALSVLFVAACFVTILSAAIIGEQLAIGLFVVLMLGGVSVLVALAIYIFQNWWS
jgi:hypothetical protein